jgi:hypothetical protein
MARHTKEHEVFVPRWEVTLPEAGESVRWESSDGRWITIRVSVLSSPRLHRVPA